MRKIMTTAAAVALIGATSYADLQNVEVGGSIRIRGNSYSDYAGYNDTSGINAGNIANNTDTASADSYTEQRTTINVSADFSDDVSAFIELDSYNDWGSDLRDAQPAGGSVSSGSNSANLYQAYIELGQVFDRDVSIKIGRQEVQLGSEFLVGNNDTAGGFTGLSFDGIVSNYDFENFNVTLMNLKVFEGDKGSTATDGDGDLRGIYASYTGIEDMVIDGYVLHARLGIPSNSPNDNADILTIGARVAGDWNQVDYEVEAAFQDGDAGIAGVDTGGMAVNAEVGYTFDTDLQPRIFGGVAFFEGADDDGTETGFNRLFSDWEYSEFQGNTDITNALIYRLGGSLQATEKIGVSAVVTQFEADEDAFYAGEDDLGTEIGLYMTYAYSEDVAVEVGAATFLNGDVYDTDTTEEDPVYMYAEISLSF